MTTVPVTDERLKVEVATDLMRATIHLQADQNQDQDQDQGQAPPTLEEVVEALKTKQICLDETVNNRIDVFLRRVSSGEGLGEPFVVAKGRPLIEGKDETFVWDPRFEKDKAEWQGDAQIDYYTLSSIVTVEADEVIGTTIPLVPSRDGFNVRGDVLRACTTPQELEIDKTIRRAPKDPKTLVANVAGRVLESGRKLKIDEVLLINGDVNFRSGNVDSTIAVQITGNIPNRFEAKSTKSITVCGAIEAAIVEAKEDVIVRGGIVGRNAGKVFANLTIVAKFCDEANLIAGGGIKVGKQIMHCRVRTDGKLAAEGAAIVGGHVWAREGIAAATLGSDAGAPTRLFTGICPDLLEDALLINQHMHAARSAVETTKEKLKPFVSNIKRLTPAQRNAATALLKKIKQATAEIQEEEERSRQLVIAPETLDKPAVYVSGTIHPRVSISTGTQVVRFRDEMRGPVSIELRKIDKVTEFVAFNPLSSSVTVLKSHKLSMEELIRDFEPLANQKPEPDSASPGGAKAPAE